MLRYFGEVVGAVGAEKSLFKNWVVEFPAIPKQSDFPPRFMFGVMSGQGVFPSGEVPPSFYVPGALGVVLLVSPPGDVFGKQGLFGEPLRG